MRVAARGAVRKMGNTDQLVYLPCTRYAPEANPSPNSANTEKWLPSAPINLPAGPPLTYPMEQASLATKRARPMAAAAMGKQMPAARRAMKMEGANSRQLAWTRWQLLNRYHSSYVSFCEYLPEPISGQPPSPMSFPVDCLCSCPKFSSMNSFVKHLLLALPGKMNPIATISSASRTATSTTQPQSLERVIWTAAVADQPRWAISVCIKIQKGGSSPQISTFDQKIKFNWDGAQKTHYGGDSSLRTREAMKGLKKPIN